MWSLGNEVRTNLTLGDYSSSEIVNVCTTVNSAVKALDATRPTTMGNNAPGGNLSALMAIVDVVGINYNGNNQTYQTDRPIYGSETTSALSSRGVYATDSANMAYPSYDNKAVSWGNHGGGNGERLLEAARVPAGISSGRALTTSANRPNGISIRRRAAISALWTPADSRRTSTSCTSPCGTAAR